MSMTPEQFRLVSAIFTKACEMPQGARAAYLDDACANDGHLRKQVEQLLDDDATPAFSLESPPIARIMRAEGASLFEESTGEPRLPRRIGDYDIVGILGRGGMGVVYEARQKHPDRSVALKVLRADLVSKSSRRRLQVEAEILGKLHHPGIASIYEAGVASESPHLGGLSDQPFFAMELIRGQPLDDYVAREKLSLKERLRLFVTICDAVHHAHENGIIHRDLKPGNILVDALGVPRILDFGIARITDADIQTTTMQTGVGQLLGTIAYMSPEQVMGDSSKLDRRSDVYALGVIGYELLSGTKPHELTEVPIPEAVRLIQDADPKPLSTISKVFRGDLDTIFCKTLEKDRDRRYPTAADLAADVRRFLAHEPIQARPSSTSYLLKKFVRRNRAVVAGLTAVFLALIAGISATSWQAYHANIAKRRAEQEAAISANISGFLQDMLTSVNPRMKNSPTITVREVVDRAASQLEHDSFPTMPDVESSIRETLGITYIALGEFSAAEQQLRESLRLHRKAQSAPDARTAGLLYQIGVTLMEVGNLAAGEQSFHEALQVFRSLSLDRTRDAVGVLSNLAYIHGERKELDQAEALNREVLALRLEILGDTHADTATSFNNLAVVLRKKGDLPAAEQAYRRSLAINRKVFGDKHIEIATNLSNLGLLRAYLGDFDEAELLLTESLEMAREFLGANHPRIASATNGLAGVLHHNGAYERAERLYREALAIATKSLGPNHRKVALFNYNLASLLFEKGAPHEALPFIRAAGAFYRGHDPVRQRSLSDALVMEGLILLSLEGDHDASAEAAMREGVSLREASFPEGHTRIAQAVNVLGESIVKQGRYAEAEPLLLESYPVILAANGQTHELSLNAMKRLVELYERWHRPEAAREWQEQLDALAEQIENEKKTGSSD